MRNACVGLVTLVMLEMACSPEHNSPTATSLDLAHPNSSEFAGVRQATAAFHDLDAAVAAGYALPDRHECVEVPGVGAMGVHSANLGLAGDLAIDPLRPEVLLYLPTPGGGFRLVGIEYFEVALVLTPSGPAPWFAPTPPPYPFVNPAPSVFGHVFDGPMAGHDPAMPWHYDQHVWIWAPNPAGDFAQFNPSLSCPSQ